MLKVGIHDNLVLKSTVKNEQGTLVINLKKMTKVDPLAALSSAGQTSFEPEEVGIMMYAPKVLDYNNKNRSVTDMLNLIAEVKDPLDHIASVYLTTKDRVWNPFVGIDINADNQEQKLTDQGTINKIYDNLVTQFIAMVKPFVGESGKRVRVLLIRQSATKHFPKFRTRYLNNQPFIESMEIPASASKLKFSEYEKTKGLDSPNQAGGEQKVDKKEASEANALFAK